MDYNKYYIIFYSINAVPYVYKFNTYKAFIAMCKQMNKSNNFDYVKPVIHIEWNSLQDLFSKTSYGIITAVGQQPKENIQTMKTANNNVKNSKLLTLNF